ncbi:MAG: DUF1330 domain-containing protein [Alphaproteobacteria bacterium]|nr:DUF1330 domain-containing protein [Alphaproteobacteria bacterium]MDE2013959.1 DUF1330 domain-containing protein [Alphaproteobacteria bacterium]MDE2073776.1 DUF1330 domain-containing protein [Alphaproteobacteria bacterium]MDE2351040.1 DUF1330 domain-containing protein [Alphaproteobacteria bacterium]
MPYAIDPTRAQFDAFKALPRDTPIHMLNLIRLNELAKYPAGHPDAGKGLTGLEAYRRYGRTTGPLFQKLGGRIVWSGRPEAVVTGPADERWDLAFIAHYPNAAAFLAMVTDGDYREHVKHRQAAVADSRLIRMAPLEPGEGFGE